MKYAKPRQLADAISVTTDALRKQRERGTSPYEYEVIEDRVVKWYKKSNDLFKSRYPKRIKRHR